MSVNITHASTTMTLPTLLRSHLLAKWQYCLATLSRRLVRLITFLKETQERERKKKSKYEIG